MTKNSLSHWECWIPSSGFKRLRERLLAGVKPHALTKPSDVMLIYISWGSGPELFKSVNVFKILLFLVNTALFTMLYIVIAVCNSFVALFPFNMFIDFSIKIVFYLRISGNLHCEFIAFCIFEVYIPQKPFCLLPTVVILRVPPAIFSF